MTNSVAESMELTESDERYWSNELGWVSIPTDDDEDDQQ